MLTMFRSKTEVNGNFFLCFHIRNQFIDFNLLFHQTFIIIWVFIDTTYGDVWPEHTLYSWGKFTAGSLGLLWFVAIERTKNDWRWFGRKKKIVEIYWSIYLMIDVFGKGRKYVTWEMRFSHGVVLKRCFYKLVAVVVKNVLCVKH